MSHITSVLEENRKFSPSKEFSQNAIVKNFEQYRETYDFSIREPEKFWQGQA